MKYPEQFSGMFKFQIPFFSRHREFREVEPRTPALSLGFPTFGTGEMNIDHMGQQCIPPTDNFNSHHTLLVRNLPPVDVLRYEQVGYYGYVGGVKLFASSAAVVEIQAGDKTEKLLAMDYAGVVLAIRKIDQETSEVIRLNLSDEIFVGYLGRGMKGRQTFSNYGDHLDAPWEKLKAFEFSAK